MKILIPATMFILDMLLDLMRSEFGKNAIIFGTDMSSSVHIDNKKKDILVSW